MRRITAFVLLAAGLLLGRSASGVQQLIQDGNFNSGAPLLFWSEGGNSASGVNFVEGNPVGFLSMGNAGGPITQEVFQSVTIPTNTLLLQFSYFWAMSSTDVSDSSELSSFLADSNDVPAVGIDNEFNQFNTQTSYAEVTDNFTNLAGLTIHVDFECQLFDAGVGANTTFGIKDVSLLAFTTADIPANDFFSNSIVLDTTSNITVFATNVLATREPNEPKIEDNPGGHSVWWTWTAPGNGTLKINTAGSTFNTLLGVFTGASLSSLKQVAANANGTGSSVKITVSAGTTYQIAVDGKNGASGGIQLNLSFVTDTTPPKVTISSPASNAKLTNSTVTVKGTASDNVAVASVEYRLENAQGTNDYQVAEGTNTWTATITDLIPGPNTIQVFALDTSSNQSTVVSRTVTFVVVSPLTVTTNGSGTVSPNLNGKLEDVGATLTLTAKPGSGQVFSNWTDADGVQLATTAAFTFTMQSNLVLQANFVPNPFTPIMGDYQGLFFDTNGPQHASSGFFNVTLSSSGSYSAKVIVAGVNYSLSGQFSAGGVASNNIVRKSGLPAVSVQLQLDLSGGGISGVLSDGTWVAQLNADPVVTSAGATAGHYTLVIPGEGTMLDPTNPPALEPGVGGDSYGTVTVSSTGSINFSGALADSTKVTQKANLTANGQWPFYIPLYSGNGSIFGWLTFSNQVDSDITGTVNWFKLAQPAAKFYPGGITNITDATGSIYLFTNGVPVLNLPGGNGAVGFTYENGSLPPGFGDQINLSTANKITSTNALTATITTSSGLFKVTATDPNTGKAVTGNGVVLQKQNSGLGFFSQTNRTAGLILLSSPD